MEPSTGHNKSRVVKRTSASRANLATPRGGGGGQRTFSNPATPKGSRHGIQKGWSSERVPAHANRGRRLDSVKSLTPSNDRRALPSKWEDAERWIASPVSVGHGGGMRKVAPHQKHKSPKSKSGPLGIGAMGISYYPSHSSPLGGPVRNFMFPGSPFSAGVFAADNVLGHCGGDMFNYETFNGSTDAKSIGSTVVSRRDVATQMSPESSKDSSPKKSSPKNSFSSSICSSIGKTDVRDVLVDKKTTTLPRSGKYGAGMWRKDPPESYSSDFEGRGRAKEDGRKIRREEAEAIALENLHKAKTEAAIQKLEMKLEKMRAAEMEKILNKLRVAELQAQKMRDSVAFEERCGSRGLKNSQKAEPSSKDVRPGLLTRCFSCRIL